MKKKAGPQFAGELATPIVMPFPPSSSGMLEQIRKLELLKRHYGVNDWMFLAYALADEFVPGFQIVYDDPLAAELRREAGLNLPISGGAKSGRKGTGQIPYLFGSRLIAFVGLVREAAKKNSDPRVAKAKRSDAAACELIAEAALTEGGRSRVAKGDVEKLAATIKRRLAKAKALQKPV